MQVMNMSQPVMSGKASSSMFDTNTTGKAEVESPFESLLKASSGEQPSEGELAKWLKKILGKNVFESILQQLEDGTSLEEIVEQFDMKAMGELLEAPPNLVEAFPFLADLVDVSGVETGSKKKESAIGEKAPQILLSMNESNANEFKMDLQQALKDISELLQTFKADGKLDNADSSKLTALLKQWSLMMRQAKDADINPQKSQIQMLDEKESDLWNKLLQRFQKRSFLAEKNMYTQNAQVTKQDVMNWLQQASENQATLDTRPVHFISREQQMPMSRVEQHVIHLESAGRVERVGSEFVEKFTNVIRESQFISRSGKMELNLMLKPSNLGHITVKMTQVNGEMMVKLLVSSQASKDMLEQNMHQLRHLFSPHQVTVERNETVTDEEFYFNEGEEDHQEKHSDERDEEDRDNNEDHSEFDFETIFNQVSEEEGS